MIIVTGAAGFIGRNLVDGLNSLGINKIICVDHLGTGEKWKNLNGLSYFDYYEKDYFLELMKYSLQNNDAKDFKDYFTKRYYPHYKNGSKITTFYHLGACSSTTEKDAGYLVRNNYEYSKIVFEFCERFQIKLIYASSAATYGMGESGFTDDLSGIKELKPLNMYGYSKQMFDLYVFNINDRQKLKSRPVGLKYFNVYGPYESHKGDQRSMILKGFEQVMENGSIKLFKSLIPDYNDGEQVRDFIYVKDAVKLSLIVSGDYFYNTDLNKYLKIREITDLFNIGTGEAKSWNRIMGALFYSVFVSASEKMRKKVKFTDQDIEKTKGIDLSGGKERKDWVDYLVRGKYIQYIDMPDSLKKQYQYYTCADMGKTMDIVKELGQVNNFSFFTCEEAINDYVTNYLIDC